MYAVIIQSAPSATTTRQTVVVPVDGRLQVFTRGDTKRGVAGSWQAGEPFVLPGELIVGEPTAIAVTENDIEVLERGDIPTVLLQKLVRRVAGITAITTDPEATLRRELELVKQEALTNPLFLQKYVGGSATPKAPLAVAVAPTPVVEPAVLAPVVPQPADIPSLELWASLGVPTREQTAGYIERVFSGKTETEVYDFARANSEAVAIFGHAGTGKTSSAQHYASLRGLPFCVFECNLQVDDEVVQGSYVPTGNGTELVWRYSALATALSQPSVVLLNESNRMSAKANALFLRILQERELQVSRHHNETIQVHPECLIVTDSNPGYRGTVASDQAFLDRFHHLLEFEYDTAIEKNFIPSSSLLTLASQLREQAEREDRWSTPVSTRLLKNFVKQTQGLGIDYAIEGFVKAFAVEEREALRMLFEVNKELIAQELGVTA